MFAAPGAAGATKLLLLSPAPEMRGFLHQDFCLVVALSSLASQAELLLSLLLLCAVGEAGFELTWCSLQGQGLAITLQGAAAQSTRWSYGDPSAEAARVGYRNRSREKVSDVI